jgi:hypothetical protein
MEYFTDTNFAMYCNQRLYRIRGEGGYPHPCAMFYGENELKSFLGRARSAEPQSFAQTL